MKRIFLQLLFGVTLLSLLSCEKFLAEEPVTEVSIDFIYTTPEGLESGVNALYNLMRNYNIPEGEGDALRSSLFFLVGTDLGLNRTWHTPYGPNHTPVAFPARKWTRGYQIIDRANAIITNAPKVDMLDTRRNQIIAQARMVRGELYLDLIRMYDNILLDTIATTPENAFDPKEYTPADPEEVFKLIDADLDFAVQHLAWNVDYGRYGRGVAHHIRGKSALWQQKWEEASTHFDAVILDPTHDLLPREQLAQVFGQNLNHKEALLVYVRDEITGGNDNLAGGGPTWISSVFNSRVYELSGGEMIRSTEYGGESLGWSFPNDYLRSLYDEENDLRFRTYYYPLQLIVNNPESPNFGQPLAPERYDDDYRRYHWSLKKYHDEEKRVGTLNSYKDHLFYRYAETLLLGAEAAWRTGNTTKALGYINQVRNRAGLHGFASFDLESYLEESARELALENERWFLLKRLGILVERVNLYYEMGSNSGNKAIYPMAPHMVRLPIPQSQIDLMGTFPQNDGY
ncbi:RagB/SusD family nutrient uptake outer membrane protein [Sphingobacterium gobiense]|nr:RagB/SusD family nutrient uptake outer membrane protein [Sphingobacterium gobiense]